MLPHAVHLGDVRPAGQQCAVDRLLVGQRQAGRRRSQQSRRAAGHQRHHKIVRSQPAHPFQQPQRAALAVGIGDGVGGLDHLDPLRRHGVAVAGDDGAFQLHVRPGVFQRGGHHRGGFAPADHDNAAGRLGRQMGGQHFARIGRGHRGVEQRTQRRSRPCIVPDHGSRSLSGLCARQYGDPAPSAPCWGEHGCKRSLA